MNVSLKVLLIEDNADDAELLLRALRRAGYNPDWRRVEVEADFLDALQGDLELVLSDYGLPQFSGLRALELHMARYPEIPFIIVSGTIGEETAVEAMRVGATDYVLKDRLVRLGPAVNRALDEGRLRRERRKTMESLQLFRALVDQSSDAFEIVDLDSGQLVDINEQECRELGFTREELLTMRVADVDPTVDPAIWAAFTHRLRASGQITGEGIHRRKDGSTFPIEYTARFVQLDRNYAVTVVRNITDRKQAEEALRASEERFRQMAENIDEVFWMTDPTKNQMLYISPGYERVWGRRCEELYATPQTWIEAILPEDRDRVLTAAKTRQVTGEYREEYRIVRPDGALRWIYDRAFPIKDVAGTVYRVVGVALDITERKKLEEQFLRAQRLEAIGTLAGGVAHDLNNILAPILMVSGLLKSRLGAEQDRNAMTMVEASATRGAAIIRQLLMFSRGMSGERLLLQLRHLLKEMSAIMTETFPREITIISRIASELWPVIGDATQLHQVLMNLCVNARDAMPNGGVLTLEGRNVTLTAEEARFKPGARAGRYALLTVQDTGHGIPSEIIGQIFEPFFTTKEVGKGTGLGLSTVLGIVRSHGGFLTVDSQPGQGAAFKVHLPAADEENAPAPNAEGDSMARGSNEMVLIVDDEADVRQMTALLLEEHGYRVVSAGNGQEAMMRFLENQDAVRVVLTDLMMPVMGGAVMIKALQGINPKLPIIATTGLDHEAKKAELAAMGVTEVLLKPCDPAKLLTAIRRKLD